MAYSSGISVKAIQIGLETGELVEGRMEQISPGIFVDYAHTPDALQAVLTTCRDLCTGRLIVVFGCGGDRDRGKRPEMGRVADEAADVIYLTSDNPRSENPLAIIEDIVSGVRDRDSIRISSDRRSAIETALSDYSYSQGDILVIAGKGHEKTQEVDGVFSPFSDSEVILECLGPESRA
jgi:UDP-N-acetylmuramoyl-L-alanyl-D-glutamate--2,6-diaminopimelate ligase